MGLLLTVVVFVFSITVHEVAHGYAAYKLGDPTAKNCGRLTLNPAKHLDPIGTLLIVLVGFGWAKPVPIDSRYFEHPRRDTTIVSLSGPISNILIAFIALLIYDKVCINLFDNGIMPVNFLLACRTLFGTMASLNVVLAVFNLLPIPPLDGSKILFTWAPYKWRNVIYRIEQFGFIGVYIVLILLSKLGIITGISNLLFTALIKLVNILPF